MAGTNFFGDSENGIRVAFTDENNKIMYAEGNTVPSDTTAGYGKGCVFIDRNGSAGAVFYVNEGSETSCDFNVSAGSTSTLSALTDTDISGLASADLLIYDGSDSWDNVAVTGDVTINSSGVTAISSDVIVNADINSSAAIAWSKMASSTDISSTGTVTDLTITSEAQGDVLYFNGTNWVRLGAGSTGQYLKTNGAGANPAWDTPGFGKLSQSQDIEAGTYDVTLSTTTQTVGAVTLTLPDFADVDDTFAFLTLQQTVKNKVLDDASVKFGDTADTTKDLFFSLGGATTNKTMTIVSSQTDDRSLTLPDATDTLVGKATTDTLTNKTLTSAVLNTGVSGTAVLDEDNMASNSATQVATQQSIKAYVDSGTVTFTNKSIDCDGTGNSITNVNGDELDSIAATNGTYGIPIVVTAVNSGSATVTIFNADAPFKFRVLDAHAVSTKAGNAGNYKLDNGTNDITTTVAYGTGDADIARITDIDDAYHEVASSGTLRLISSNAADTAIVYVTIMRVD